ncbi:STAS domain-containing protein [Mycobacterium colombiense]|nr:STAS domain-containing protein [Mycobacterium colombiense]
MSANTTPRRFMPASCMIDCNGAQLRAHSRGQVTVVEVTGDIDATNIDRFYDYVNRFVGQAPGLILDLRGVDFICVRAISILMRINDDCRAAGTRWAIVGGPFVRRLLHLGDPGETLPTADSGRQALNRIAIQNHTRQAAS